MVGDIVMMIVMMIVINYDSDDEKYNEINGHHLYDTLISSDSYQTQHYIWE